MVSTSTNLSLSDRYSWFLGLAEGRVVSEAVLSRTGIPVGLEELGFDFGGGFVLACENVFLIMFHSSFPACAFFKWRLARAH